MGIGNLAKQFEKICEAGFAGFVAFRLVDEYRLKQLYSIPPELCGIGGCVYISHSSGPHSWQPPHVRELRRTGG